MLVPVVFAIMILLGAATVMGEEAALGAAAADQASANRVVGLGAAAALAIAVSVLGAGYAVGAHRFGCAGTGGREAGIAHPEHPFCRSGGRIGRPRLRHRHDAGAKNIGECPVKFFCIGDADTVAGFRLAGIAGETTETPEETKAAMEAARSRPACGVIIITEQLADSIRDTIEAMRLERQGPLVVENTRAKRYSARPQKSPRICPGGTGVYVYEPSHSPRSGVSEE